ncbi:MAG: DUF1624 domain-containing protein [Sulfurovum sp.]|nr:MAG: DUF1624 domain-containing protein [Sulfurovum sp.]
MRSNRINGLDIFRGWAILLMIAYHFGYDLKHFDYISVDLGHDTFWVYSRYIIVSMFLVSVGMSLKLAHTPNIKWYKMKKRTLLLGGASLLVSVGTYLQFPHTWVYFGILHFILVASWVGLLFLPYPRLALATAIIIFIGSLLGWLHMHGLFALLQTSLHLPPEYTQDGVQFFPWFGAVLMGVVFVSYNLHTKLLKNTFFSPHTSPNKVLAFFGRHALIIYLIHQPILFGLFSLFH